MRLPPVCTIPGRSLRCHQMRSSSGDWLHTTGSFPCTQGLWIWLYVADYFPMLPVPPSCCPNWQATTKQPLQNPALHEAPFRGNSNAATPVFPNLTLPYRYKEGRPRNSLTGNEKNHGKTAADP